MSDTLDQSALADDLLDRQSIELPDGRTLRLVENPDYDCQISDFDCYGRIEFIPRHKRQHSTRPDGFDGFARKVWSHNGECFWWQPPDDLRTAKREPVYVEDGHGVVHRHPYVFTDPVGTLQRNVADLLTFGFVVVGVEVLSDCESCHRAQVIGSAYIGGVEAMADRDYTLDLVADLVAEALADAKS